MRKFSYSFTTAAVIAAGLIMPTGVAHAGDIGGWSETSGLTVINKGVEASSARKAAAANHRGKAEEKTISGTTNKRAHSGTTWIGEYHYTTAQMQAFGGGTVYTTSGRKWEGTGTCSPTFWMKPSKRTE